MYQQSVESLRAKRVCGICVCVNLRLCEKSPLKSI